MASSTYNLKKSVQKDVNLRLLLLLADTLLLPGATELLLAVLLLLALLAGNVELWLVGVTSLKLRTEKVSIKLTRTGKHKTLKYATY